MIAGGVVFVSGLLWLIFGSSESKNADSKPAKSQPVYSEPAKSVPKLDSKTKGNNFEDYVANILKANNIRIKEWNKGSVTDDGAFGENALNPDMFVADNTGKMNLEYWIECKYKSSLPNVGFELKQKQLDRYSEIQRNSRRKVLLFLGLGGSSDKPASFYVVPLDSIKKYKHIPERYLKDFLLGNPSVLLKDHIRGYFFNEVFKK